MSTVQEIANVAWWVKAGLPGMPVSIPSRKGVDPAKLLRDASGKPILCNSKHRTAIKEALQKRFDRDFEDVMFVTDIEVFERFKSTGIPKEAYAHSEAVGFVVSEGRPLSVPEREAAAAVAWLFGEFVFSAPSSPYYKLPTLLHEMADEDPDGDHVIPVMALTEDRAFQLSLLVERHLETTPDVVKDGDGYFVTIPHDAIDGDPAALVKLGYMLDFLYFFDITPHEGGIDCFTDQPGASATLRHLKSIVTQQQRIETKLDGFDKRTKSILEAVDYMFATHYQPVAQAAEEIKAAISAIPADRPFILTMTDGTRYNIAALLEWKGNVGKFSDTKGAEMLIPLSKIRGIGYPDAGKERHNDAPTDKHMRSAKPAKPTASKRA